MTPSRIRTTRCPKCHTSFRVTQAQLRAAGGSVRCGSCLNVFNAGFDTTEEPESNHSETSGQATPAETETAKPSLPEKAVSPQKSPSAETNQEHAQSFPLSTLLNKVDKEQVEIRQERRPLRRKNSKKRLPEYAVAVLACLTLGLQYLWFNRNELSLDPAFRPYFEWVCKGLDCELPPVVNLSEIQSSQLLVRIHPDIEEMMVVDAVIINKASHPQPWPKLSLTFSDLLDQPVASRTFSPREYLGGELAGTKEMPANQAIRLSLELLDPGPDAVNYRLTFKRKTR